MVKRGRPPHRNNYGSNNNFLNAVRRYWEQGSSNNTPVNVEKMVESERKKIQVRRQTGSPQKKLQINQKTGANVAGFLGHPPVSSLEQFFLNFPTNLAVAPEEAQRLKKLPKPNPQNTIEISDEEFVVSEPVFASKQFSIESGTKFNLEEIEKQLTNNKNNSYFISGVKRGGRKTLVFKITKSANDGAAANITVIIYSNGTVQVSNSVIELTNNQIKIILSKIIGRELKDPKKVIYISKFCIYRDNKPQQIDPEKLLEPIRKLYRNKPAIFEHLINKIANRNVEALSVAPQKPVQSKRAVTLNVPVQPISEFATKKERQFYYVDATQIRIVIKLNGKKIYLVISNTGIITAFIDGEYKSGPEAFKKLIKTTNISNFDDIFQNTNQNHILRGIALPKKQRQAAKMQENRAIRMAKNADDISNREKNNFYVHLKLKTLGNGNKPVFSIRQQPNKKSNSFVRERGKLLTSYRSWGMLNLNNISKHTRNVWGINKNVIDKFKGTSAKSAAQSAKKRKRNTQPTFSRILPNASNWIKRVFKKNGTAEILKTSGLPKRELYYPNETPGKKGEYGLLPAGNITKKKEKFIKGLKAQGGRIRDLPKNVKNALKLSNTPNSNSNSNNTNVRELERIMLEAQAESAERKRAAASAERKRAAASAERKRAAASAEKKRAAASAERRERIEAAKRQQQINNKRRENQDKLRKLQNNINKMKRKTIESARLATVSGASRQSASPISPPNKQYGTMFNKLGKRKSPI